MSASGLLGRFAGAPPPGFPGGRGSCGRLAAPRRCAHASGIMGIPPPTRAAGGASPCGTGRSLRAARCARTLCGGGRPRSLGGARRGVPPLTHTHTRGGRPLAGVEAPAPDPLAPGGIAQPCSAGTRRWQLRRTLELRPNLGGRACVSRRQAPPDAASPAVRDNNGPRCTRARPTLKDKVQTSGLGTHGLPIVDKLCRPNPSYTCCPQDAEVEQRRSLPRADHVKDMCLHRSTKMCTHTPGYGTSGPMGYAAVLKHRNHNS